jgi:hypothetical protein
VTAPSGARTRYRFDPRDGSVLWVQNEPSHDLRVDGRIPELADRYDAGTDPLEAVIEAAGAQGVRSVGLEIDGVVHATEAADCTSGCPSAFDADVAVPSSGLTEGRHVARVRAEGANGQLSVGDPLVFFIDRSAPAPPAGFTGLHDATTGVLQVAWDVPSDPVLADGSPGSGIRDFVYRYRVDGSAWSDWLLTADPTFAVIAGHVGSTVTLEARARDNVGRESAVGGASVIAGEADVGADASFFEEDVEAEGFDAAAPVIGLRCFIGNPGDLPRVRPVHAGERRIVIETDVNAYCRAANPSSPRQQEAAALATLSMRVCVEVEDPSWRNLDCKSGRKTGTRRDNKLSVTAAELCRPGAKRYRTSADITVKGPGIQYIGTRGPSATEAVSLGCNEAGAWRRLATRSGSPGRLLGNALESESTPFEDRDGLPQGDSSLGPRRGWEAHHIVPGGEGRVREGRKGIANDAQTLAYTCDVGPNEGVNGVWLRGRFLVQGMPGYNMLDDAGKRRPAHGNVHTVRYYRWLRDNLHRHASYTGVCRSRSGARSALRSMRDKIISGEFPR